MTLTNYEKYLAGEPLTEELRALKEGREQGEDQSIETAIAQQPVADPERPLTADERSALREMRHGEAWPVLQRLLEGATIQHTRAAIKLSEEDPLDNRDAIAQAWLTVKVWKTLHMAINFMVDSELQKDRQGREDMRNGEGS